MITEIVMTLSFLSLRCVLVKGTGPNMAMVVFAGEESDIEILEKGKKRDRANIKDAAYRLETAAHSKLLEFEDSSIDINEKSTKPKATYPLDWDVA